LQNIAVTFLSLRDAMTRLDAFIVDRSARGVSVGEKKTKYRTPRALEMATVSFQGC